MSKTIKEMNEDFEKTHDVEEITYISKGVHTYYVKYKLGELVWLAQFDNKCEEKTYDTILSKYRFRPIQGKINAIIIKPECTYYQLEGRKGTYMEPLVFRTKKACEKDCDRRNI